MKKFLIFGLGITLLSSSILPIIDAGKRVSKTYVSGKVRRFSGRIGPFVHQKTLLRSERGRDIHWIKKEARKYRSTFKTGKINTIAKVRANDPAPKLVANKRFQIQDAGEYFLTIPQGFRKTRHDTYTHFGSKTTFRVVKTTKKYSCPKDNFSTCAITLGKDFERTQNITGSSAHIRAPRLAMASAPVFIESFEGTVFGKRNTYFVLNALNPEDGSIVRIEAVVAQRLSEQAAKTMFKVFESFKFKSN